MGVLTFDTSRLAGKNRGLRRKKTYKQAFLKFGSTPLCQHTGQLQLRLKTALVFRHYLQSLRCHIFHSSYPQACKCHCRPTAQPLCAQTVPCSKPPLPLPQSTLIKIPVPASVWIGGKQSN